ncbi:YpjP family protein [Virgibacillus flavescens]|uniref:YpjP family protein n=1 Tax=Virgibacillus flavescens TaxID=1611422 RepID=UPI003D3261D9
MKLWFRKVTVILVTFMALGMYIPPTYLNEVDAEENSEAILPEDEPTASDTAEDEVVDSLLTDAAMIDALTEQATNQTITKLGPKIGEQIQPDFTSAILPNMKEVLNRIMEEASEESPYLAITETPAKGYGEKIFNLYDYQTKKDIARFHVRRENRPLEGYWFNFHYHVRDDNFESHHEIGEIYWDKNIPPKWMS